MSEKNKQRMEKFVALCDSGKPWYVFLVLFSLLLAANALLELLTGTSCFCGGHRGLRGRYLPLQKPPGCQG